MTTPPPRSRERWVPILLALLTLGAWIPIWTAPIPPLQDLPNHLLKIDIFQRWMRGEAGVRLVYALNLKLLANYTCYLILLALTPIFGLILSARILLSLIVAGLPWSAYAFLRRVNGENTLFALAAPALNFSLFFMMGNLNFCLGLSLYLAALTVFVSEAFPSRRATLGFGLLATGLYFTHGFVFVILVGAVVFLLGIDPRPVRRWRAAGLVPGILCLAINIAGTLASGKEAAGAFIPGASAPGLNSARVALVWLLNPHGWGYDTTLALGWIAVIALCAAGTIAAAVIHPRAGGGFKDRLRENPWLVLALLLVVGFIIAPGQLRDWFHLRPRFSPLALLTLLGGLRLPRGKAVRVAVAAVFVITAIAIETRNTQELRRRGEQVAEYVRGVDSVAEGSSILPVENIEYGPKYRTNLHSWAYYTIARGGWSPYLHNQPSYNPVVYKVTPWGPEEGLPLQPDDILRRIAACYDYVLLWNPKPGDAAALRPYFALVQATGRLRVWQNLQGLRRSTPASNPACRQEEIPGGGSAQ